MRIAVTGGAGFIGTNLARHLTHIGVSPIVLDNFATGLRENLTGLDAELVEGSILDPNVLDRVFSEADGVVHLAARPSVPRSITDPIASNDVNVNGTLQVLEAARRQRVPHIVVASSSSIYGANPILPKHEDLVPMPLSPYAASKLATESYALAYGACFDLEVLALRFFNVFGPYQLAGHAYAAVIPAFVSAALLDDTLTIHGDGTQTRDFTYVGSVVRVIGDAIQRRVSSTRSINLAFGERISLLDLVGRLESIIQRPLRVHHVASRPGDVRDSQADNGRLLQLFPDVTPTPVNEGLSETVDWFKRSLGTFAGEHS